MSGQTLTHKQVVTRKPHRCIFCWAGIPTKQMSLPGTEPSEPVQEEMFVAARKDVG